MTANGVTLLRVVLGLFFVVSGAFKLIDAELFAHALEWAAHRFGNFDAPALNALRPDYAALLAERMGPLAEHSRALLQFAAWTELAGGAMLVFGWNLRLAVLPLLGVTIVAGLTVVRYDADSAIRTASLLAHIMAAALYLSLFFFGAGRFALDGRHNVVRWLARRGEGPAARAAAFLVSGRGRNAGVFFLRVGLSFPFLAIAALIVAGRTGGLALPESVLLQLVIALIAAAGGFSLLTGFKTRFVIPPLAALTILHLVVAAWPDLARSAIGTINIGFHLLLLTALYVQRLIRLGADLEIEHILAQDKKNIVVIGGGFAGASLVKRLEGQLPDDYQLVLVSEENYTTFNPLLAEVVSGDLLPAHAIASLRQMVRRTRIVAGRAIDADWDAGTLRIATDGFHGELPFEHLVLAFGARAATDAAPGMAGRALPFKSLGDAVVLRNRIIAQLELAELEPDPARRKWLGHFIIVGGGFSGAEAAGAIFDFIRAAEGYYPRLCDKDLNVTLIHSRDLPIPELPPALGRHAKRSWLRRGLKLHLGVKVDAVDAQGVAFSGRGGSGRVDGATIVNTIGVRPNGLVARLGLPTERGRIKAAGDMRVDGFERVWAAGDCALIANAHDGEPAPPTAQFALREGRQLADNIARAVRGRETRAFSYKPKGMMATIGRLNGVAEAGALRLKGFPAWLLWRAFYLSFMPTWLKRTKIFFEWTWSMLFSPEIVNLRFTTSQDALDRLREDENTGAGPVARLRADPEAEALNRSGEENDAESASARS